MGFRAKNEIIYSRVYGKTKREFERQMADSGYKNSSDFMEYLQTGLQILAVYTHLEYLLVLIGIVVLIDAAMLIYHFVMWVLKKIPMLGIE